MKRALVLGLLTWCCGVPCHSQSAKDAIGVISDAKQLQGHLHLSSGERVCSGIPVHSDRAIRLGQAQLTVTLSAHVGKADDVTLVLSLPKAGLTVTQADESALVCGTVPALGKGQRGLYEATDFTVHLGSGNETNIGTPDDRFIDTKKLAATLQSVKVSFEQ